MELKQEYEIICNCYVSEFLKKADLKVKWYWILDDVGGVVDFNYFYLDFYDIRYFVDNNLTYKEIENHLEYYEIKRDTEEYENILTFSQWHERTKLTTTNENYRTNN